MSNKTNDFIENDIRPDDLMVEQKKAVDADANFLHAHQSEFVDVSCPACQSSHTQPRFEKRGFQYMTCGMCSTFYMSPRPSPQLLEKFYESSENYAYWNNYIFPRSEKVRREKIFIPRVDMVLELCDKHKVETGSILEVGAGFGLFCEELISRKVFSDVMAVEPTPDLAETCRKKGINVIEKPVEDIYLDEQELFDVVVNFEVIEHLFSPKDFIDHCRRLTKPGGLLIITCPNGSGFEVDVLGAVSDTIDHEHINYFNPDSLAMLLTSCGFKVVQKLTPGKLDAELVRKKVLAGTFDLSKEPFLQKVLIDKWDTLGTDFQTYLSSHLQSSNMLLVARKGS